MTLPKTKFKNFYVPGSMLSQKPKILVMNRIFPAHFLWHTGVFVAFGLLYHRS